MPPAKKFWSSDPSSIAPFLRSLLLSRPGSLAKLEGCDVLLHSSYSSPKVHLLSGGGSGHEPAHAGFLGAGMLSGAICGGVFASPSVASVLAGVRAVGGPALLIVKNYTGDRLNFGMAAEMAGAEERDVAVVVVSDDVAISVEKQGLAGARGLAGTVFVRKCAGAAAAKGATLEEVRGFAERAAGAVRTLGVSLENVDVPGAAGAKEALGEDVMEIGMGIHGEPGRERATFPHAGGLDGIVAEVLKTIYEYGYQKEGETTRWRGGEEVSVLINNLGGCSVFEMGTIAEAVVRTLESGEGTPWGEPLRVSRIYVGSYMTSFDMHGFSISVMPTDDELGGLLDAPTDAPAWVPAEHYSSAEPRPSLRPLPAPAAAAAEDAVSGGPPVSPAALAALRSACDALLALEPQLTEWDTLVGDGDCGLTMSRGAREILSRLDAGSWRGEEGTAGLFTGLAEAVGSSMGGTSGVLLELFLRRAATAVREGDVRGAYVAGVDAVMFYGGAKVGYRTMVDALQPAAEVAKEGGSAQEMAAAAEKGAEATAHIQKALAGRSNYIREGGLDGIPDPGAKAVAAILTAIANTEGM
uniref:Dihydroxyacetone kinase n=2 Tax=Corethron hystrix TaxID=216773 RepID=A0A7S1FU79_9STRA